MLISSLYAGTPFTMGKGKNWKVMYPELGPSLLTLNHALHQSGNEFTQHRHDESVDIIIVLDGEGSLRQGQYYTPLHAFDAVYIPAGEVHGTVNTSTEPIRLMSFQAPPDQLLYAGERDQPAVADDSAKHDDFPYGVVSSVDIISLLKGSLLFRTDGAIVRRIFGKKQPSGYTELVYISLGDIESVLLQSLVQGDESILVMLGGTAVCRSNGESFGDGARKLKKDDVLWFARGEELVLEQIAENGHAHGFHQAGITADSSDRSVCVICSHSRCD